MLILAADIGGTNARLLLAACGHGDSGHDGARPGGVRWRALRRQVVRSADFAGIEALLEHFLPPGEHVHAACLAVAGPVRADPPHGGPVRLTNLPWTVDADALAARFGFDRVRLLNDFAAQAHGLPLLGADDVRTLQRGVPQAGGVCALIGAGTGLGMALLAGAPDATTSGGTIALPSEGGHADFAPRDAQQIALLQHLLPVHGRVSLELLLSGHGLERLYRFVARLPAAAAPADPIGSHPDAGAISAAALAGEAQAAAAVELFARLLAAAAGNLALTSLARGGVFLSGGIAPRILPFLQQPAVRAAFTDKPPMRALLEQIPLHVVTNDQLGLLGAAEVAARLAAHTGAPRPATRG